MLFGCMEVCAKSDREGEGARFMLFGCMEVCAKSDREGEGEGSMFDPAVGKKARF